MPKNITDPAESLKPNLTEVSKKDFDAEVKLDEIELLSDLSEESSSSDDDSFDATGECPYKAAETMLQKKGGIKKRFQYFLNKGDQKLKRNLYKLKPFNRQI